ncbi:MAG: hypothetical protein TREMPRED_002228 [Tremellales sp. Tagirdzhanova-0007]|nr:MAG: hypothetical protein TREMPRED_002228 [Tremellales sp. Tagirdzhanova-0007]
MSSYLTRLIAYVSPLSMMSQMWPPPSKFTLDDMPDLTGKVVLVTGGTFGVGYAMCSALLKHNAKVYMTSRSISRGEAAIAKLKMETGKEAILLKLDLSDLNSVKSAADEFLSNEDHLDVLFENAGLLVYDLSHRSASNIDISFAVHCLGHAYLDRLLLPALLNTIEKTGAKARVVSIDSDAHGVVPHLEGIEWESLKVDKSTQALRKRLGVFAFYGQSKMA